MAFVRRALDSNQLTGTIPTSLGSVTTLTGLCDMRIARADLPNRPPPYYVGSRSHCARWRLWCVECTDRRGVRAQGFILESAYWHHPHFTG